MAKFIFLAILLAGCRGESKPSDARFGRAVAPTTVHSAGDDEATSASQKLSAKLEFVRWNASEGRLYVDFLLKNESEGEILIWERWNSWGHYAWTIELRNEARDTIAFGGWQTAWTENYGSALAIEPGGVFRMKSYLQMKDSDGSFGVSEGE